MRNQLFTLLPLAASAVVLLTALASPVAAGSDDNFGSSVRNNIEAQTIEMDPKYEGTLIEGGVGHRSSLAVRRYMTDKVRPLASADLRSIVGQQGGTTKSGDPNVAGNDQ